jgi:hypothetical protein
MRPTEASERGASETRYLREFQSFQKGRIKKTAELVLYRSAVRFILY